MESRDERDAEPDHDAAHDQRAKDSPDKDTMLRARRNAEVAEDKDEDENVIDAERVFDEVAGEEIERVVRPLRMRQTRRLKPSESSNPDALRTEAARMLSSRSRRLKLIRSNASAMKTPA